MIHLRLALSIALFGTAFFMNESNAQPPPPNVILHAPSDTMQNEEQIWINLTDSSNVVAVWRDFRLGYRRVGVGVSTDGGATWSDSLVVGFQDRQSDPALVGDNAGTFFMTVLDRDTTTSDSNGMAVWRSTDGGTSWAGPVAVVPYGPAAPDKEFTAIDRTGGPFDGNYYVC